MLRRGTPAGGLALYRMGQWFGGRPVPLVGVGAVAIAPEHRGTGTAERLMEGTLRELRAEGIALSGLYPATQRLYRKGGYEQAGGRYHYSMPLARLRPGLSAKVTVSLDAET